MIILFFVNYFCQPILAEEKQTKIITGKIITIITVQKIIAGIKLEKDDKNYFFVINNRTLIVPDKNLLKAGSSVKVEYYKKIAVKIEII